MEKENTPQKPIEASPNSIPSEPIAPPNPSPQTPGVPIAPAAPLNPPAVVVLQWLTYAFWGWAIIALSTLTAAVMSTWLDRTDSSSVTTYALAALLVLLPLALVCDILYAKREPRRKAGAATIVMVIHAVIFALLGIGSLIVAVFSIVSMFTNGGDTTTSQIYLYTSLIVFLCYLAVFMRTLNPPSLPWVRRVFIIFMLCVMGLIASLGIIGPITQERARRNDKLIEANISKVVTAIRNYTRDNNRLPDSLTDLSLSGDTALLVKNNLVEYQPNTLEATTISPSSRRTTKTNSKSYYYKLCVHYKFASRNHEYYDDDLDIRNTNDDASKYRSYISSAYNHPAGRVCYNTSVTDYNY